MHERNYDLLTRWLHLGIALSITLSLGLTLHMSARDPAGVYPWDIVAFNLHKIIGLNAQVLILIYLFWAARRQAKPLAELYPWLSRRRWQELMRGKAGRPPAAPPFRASSCVQGLGLLTALLATSSGTMLILALILPASLSSTKALWTALHSYSGNAMWGYLCIHTGAAVVHLLRRERVLFRIFRILEG